MKPVPQPAVERMVDFTGNPLVVGVVPGQPALVALTAASLARAVRAPAMHFAYVDTSRYIVEEHDDGSVLHAPLDPDSADDTWEQTEADLREHLAQTLGADSAPWHLHYLAGRPDRSLTHLARAVNAAAIVVGTRAPGPAARTREFFEGSIAVHLAHHQHRPVLTVPLSVVDWKEIRTPWER
jgi:nucleotide-binding universal stress UspA family protein